MASIAGMGALPIVLDVGVAALDVLLGYWIFKYARVLLAPPSTALNGEVGVFSGLRNSEMFPINSLSDPINALSQPLKTFSSLLFGWDSPFGVIRLPESYDTIFDQCETAYSDGVPMPKYNVGGFVLQPNFVVNYLRFGNTILGWWVTSNDHTSNPNGIMGFSKQYVLGYDAGGTIKFADE